MYDAGTISFIPQTLAVKRQPGPTVILRVSWMLLAGVLLAVGSGCSLFQGARDYVQYNDATDEFVVGWRNYVWANKAWHARKAYHACEPQLYDFGEGFRAGYRDAAAGGNGCPPPLPPRNYWSWKFQSPEGQAKIAAWFAGYPHGAKAAEEDGAGNWRQIPVSHVIEQQYSAEFTQAQIPRCDGNCYPQPTPSASPGSGNPAVDQLLLPQGVPYERQLPSPTPVPYGPASTGTDQNLGAAPPNAMSGLSPTPRPTGGVPGYVPGSAGAAGY